MKNFTLFFAKRRFNYVDVIGIFIATSLFIDGLTWAAIATVFGFVFVSSFLEARALHD